MSDEPNEPLHRNEILLLGRLSAPAETRTLPSGDEIASFRLVVSRPATSTRGGHGRREPTIDTLECAATSAVLRRRVLGWAPGDVVEVHGALRRRFWRGAQGVMSKCEVHVVGARRVRRA